MWFTVDTHFGHSNIIELTHRPFSSVQEMDRRLIANINDRVSARDSLYILGDFSFRMTVEEATSEFQTGDGNRDDHGDCIWCESRISYRCACGAFE